MSDFKERREEQLEREGLETPADVRARFAELDTKHVTSIAWKLGVGLVAAIRHHGHGGILQVPIEHAHSTAGLGVMFTVDGDTLVMELVDETGREAV